MAINDVSLTAGMRSNLLSLQNTVKLLDRTQERLSTGKKVNTAIDNPTSFFAAQSLNSRASVIDSLKDAMGQAVQTVTAADKGITAISSMIEQAKGIAQAALSVEPGETPDPTTGTADVDAIFYASLVLSFEGIDNGQTFGIAGETFTVKLAGANVTAGEFGDINELAQAINANTTLTELGYSAEVIDGDLSISLDGGSLELDDIEVNMGTSAEWYQDYGEPVEFSMTFTIGATAYNGTGATAAAAATALDAAITAAVTTADTVTVSNAGAVEVTYEFEVSDELQTLINQYNELRNQLDTLAADSGYRGKNLLGGDTLTVKFEGSHTLAVQGFDASTAATGLNISQAAWTNEATINASIDQLDAAAVTLRSEASKLSGNLSIITVRQEFSTNMINTLTAGADKLTLADANEEGANMLMLQTRQSLSTTALSLSAQAAQSVLRLFA